VPIFAVAAVVVVVVAAAVAVVGGYWTASCTYFNSVLGRRFLTNYFWVLGESAAWSGRSGLQLPNVEHTTIPSALSIERE